jgi:hypothetical protein
MGETHAQCFAKCKKLGLGARFQFCAKMYELWRFVYRSKIQNVAHTVKNAPYNIDESHPESWKLVIITHFLGQMQTHERLWLSFEVHDRPVVAWRKVVGEGGNHASIRRLLTRMCLQLKPRHPRRIHFVKLHASTARQLLVPYV